MKTIFKSPSIKGNGGKNKGKKYWTKEINDLYNNMVIGITIFIVMVAALGAMNTYHTKKYNEIMGQFKQTMPVVMDEFKTHIVKAENVEIITEEKDGKGVESVEQTIRRIANENNFQYTDYLVRLANCESRLNPKAVNTQGNKPARSRDRGLFQINDYYHKHISDAQAFDVEFSTKYTMKLINEGKQEYWVCNDLVKRNPTKYTP